VENLQWQLNNAVEELIPQVNSVRHSIWYTEVAKEIQFWLFIFVGVIAVGYIIYIGAQLLWSPWNMEEMSKALKSMMYIVIGLAIIPFAYFLIKLIISIRL
jgi:hypothetical protein